MGGAIHSETDVSKQETPEEYGARMIKGFTNWLNALTPPSDAHELALVKEILSECIVRADPEPEKSEQKDSSHWFRIWR